MIKEKGSGMAKAPDQKKEGFLAFITYGTLGLEMGLSVAIGIAIGYFLDSRFNTKPILSIVFLLFGVAAGMKRLYAALKRAEREDEGRDNS
jgi:ATP synthase protein I